MNPALDVSVEVEAVRPNRKLRTGPPRRDPGGGGINVARVLTRLGVEAEAWFASGGAVGEQLQALLTREGVACRPFPVAETTRENVTVVEAREGGQYRFVLPGARLDAEEWEAVLDALDEAHPPPGWLVGSGSLPPGVPTDFWARLARRARDRDMAFVLDSSGDALAAALDAGVELVKPNARELGEVVGREIETEADQEEAARAVVEQGGARVVVLSLGASGLLAVTRDGALHRIRSPSVRPRSRVGAGDSTVAGIVAGLALGHRLEDALRLGVAAGAAAVSTPGTELARAEDVEEIFASRHDDRGVSA